MSRVSRKRGKSLIPKKSGMTLTFSDSVENHFGMNQHGEITEGYSVQDLIDSEQITSIESKSEIPSHVLLDRFEILYPNVSRIADLRRAVIDQDLSSIFRLCDENEELRKAVIEENPHSIFRVLGESKCKIDNLTDIRKTVVEKNLNSLFRLLEHQNGWHVDDLRRAMLEENLHSLFRLFPEDDAKINLYRTN